MLITPILPTDVSHEARLRFRASTPHPLFDVITFLGMLDTAYGALMVLEIRVMNTDRLARAADPDDAIGRYLRNLLRDATSS